MATFFLAFEMVTKFRLLGCWIALGCAAGAGASAAGFPSLVQYALAAGLSVAALRFLREPAAERLERFLAGRNEGPFASLRDARVVGSVVECTEGMSAGGRGRVRTPGGIEYPAFLDDEGCLDEGERAFVRERVGGVLAVVPLDTARKA